MRNFPSPAIIFVAFAGMILASLLCAALLSTGCQNLGTGPAPTAPPAPSAPIQAAPLRDTASAAPRSKTPIKDSIVALLEQESSLFPSGTQLKSIKLEEGVVSLDFSKEFNGLTWHG